MYYEVYKKLKKQESYDDGMTWSDVYPAVYMKGDFICNNTTCSATMQYATMYEWSGETQVVSSDNGQTWAATGRQRISDLDQSILDALEREMEAFAVEEIEQNEPSDEPSEEPAEEVSETTDYNLYYLEQKQVKVRNNWVPFYPIEYRLSNTVAEANSPTCGYENIQVQYRWVDTGEVICDEAEGSIQYKWVADPSRTICVGNAKYELEVKYYSNDAGLTWYKVDPEETRSGSLITNDSQDCQMTITVTYNVNLANDPEEIKVVSEASQIEYAMLEGEQPIELYGNNILKSDLPSGIASFDIQFRLNSGELPMRFLYNITRVRAADLAAGITNIGQNCFAGTRLATLKVRADDCFLGGLLPISINDIRVPSSRVNYYKQAYNWSNYANKISAI